MKRILAIVCLAVALPGVLAAKSNPRPLQPHHLTFTRVIGGVLSYFRTHWRITPMDGGSTQPPPGQAPPVRTTRGSAS